MNRDDMKEKAKGGLKEAQGKVERAAGDLLDDDRLRGRGELHRGEGKLHKAVADLKEGVKEGVERVIGKTTRTDRS